MSPLRLSESMAQLHFPVSRTRCGILHAAPQSRDRTKRRRFVRPRLCSAPRREERRAALRPGNETCACRGPRACAILDQHHKPRDEMPRILMTGAAGEIGTRLRKLLPPVYPDLVLNDMKTPADLGSDEKFKAADLADLAQVESICEGIDGILHFGGFSVEGPWDSILQSSIIGCYNLFEAARKKGVKRIVFA